MKRWFVQVSLLPLASPALAQARPPAPAPTSVTSCAPCHRSIVESFIGTAHFRTSALATATTVKGRFAEGRNLLRTRTPDVFFKLEHRPDGFYQTAYRASVRRSWTEKMDLVIGSGRKGQSYLYWRDGLLFELPVSYLTDADWINSPGYQDGEIDFGRLIPPRCLECHATTFRVERVGQTVRYAGGYELGIGCAKCHGDGSRHAQYHAANPGIRTARFILNPRGFAQERKLDNCGLCHSGPRALIQPPFSYRPGDPLDAYMVPAPNSDRVAPDVHGNQVALVRGTKCFRNSPGMSCATCHDVHRTERDLTAMAGKCLHCHRIATHPNVAAIGQRMTTGCIDCHMPNEPSKALDVNTPTGRFAPAYRSHAIAIYPGTGASLPPRGGQKPKRPRS